MQTDVVIGGGSGMGAAIARRLAQPGRRLVIADLDLAAAALVAEELPGDVVAQRCDITSGDDLAGLASTVGPVGRLVLTAALSPTMAPGRRIYEVDLVAPAVLLDAFAATVGAGSVVLLFSSMAGHLAPADAGIDAALDQPLAPTLLEDLEAAGAQVDSSELAYTFAKRGVMRLVRRTATAWGERGVRVLSLSPGIVDTAMGHQEHEAQPIMAGMVSSSPLARMITADEIAAVAAFMLSDAAAALTATDVLVDGGAVAAFMG